MSQWSAQAFCSQEIATAYLSDISSQDEYNWIKQFVRNSDHSLIWVILVSI